MDEGPGEYQFPFEKDSAPYPQDMALYWFQQNNYLRALSFNADTKEIHVRAGDGNKDWKGSIPYGDSLRGSSLAH